MSIISISLQLPNENLSILSRAAEISAYIKSTTIGPNSTFDNKENEDVTVNQTDSEEKKVKKSPYKSENSINQQVVEKFSRMDINDIKAFQQQIQDHNLDKKIELEVRKKLEVKRAEEMASYLKIKNSIELMRQEAEKRHQLKMQEFERQIQAELEKEKQNELVYQAQRKTLATNNKKIQEQKEKQLKEQVKRFEDVYCKQETAFTKIIQSCNPEMSSALDAFKKQLTDIKNYKDSQKGSLEGTKASCIKLDALCQNLQKEIKEFETVLQARKAQKEAEEKKNAQLAAEAQKKEVIVPKQIVAIPPRSHEQASQQGIQDSSSTESEAFRIYSQYRQLLVAKREQTKRLEDTPELQQLRFALKHAINNPINLLNENQRMTLVEGYQKLFNLLSNQRINTPKGCVAVTDHVEASDWCRLKIAEKIIVSFKMTIKQHKIIFFNYRTDVTKNPALSFLQHHLPSHCGKNSRISVIFSRLYCFENVPCLFLLSRQNSKDRVMKTLCPAGDTG